jgi:cell division protein FtsI/penicillin-binding protein 2
MEPGSTFKALVVAAAFNEGLIRLEDQVDCEGGAWMYRGFRVRDDGRNRLLTVEQLLAKSSNVGAAKIGVQLGQERLYQYARGFGMGEPTRIHLGGEVSGLLHPLRSWSRWSVASIPIGYEVAVTPLQMAMAMSAIANGGTLMRPMVVSELVDQDGKPVERFYPTPVRQVLGEAASAMAVRALATAVAEGTGRRAQLDFYQVAGKTGTARKLVNGQYSATRHVGSFIGFFPAHDPQLCIAVVVDEPRSATYGGETAAPVFRRIGERAAVYLAIPPTPNPDDTLLTRGEPTGAASGRGRAGQSL